MHPYSNKFDLSVPTVVYFVKALVQLASSSARAENRCDSLLVFPGLIQTARKPLLSDNQVNNFRVIFTARHLTTLK